MKLRQIVEGFWTLAPGEYPNSLAQSILKAKDTEEGKPERHSPLLHPKDRDRFIKWGYKNGKANRLAHPRIDGDTPTRRR